MRECIRCGSEMKENCGIKMEGTGYGIVMSSDKSKLFACRIGFDFWQGKIYNKFTQKLFFT